MPFVDDRGRLFGRFNVLDAIVLALLVLFVPVAYGAYNLFHDPLPMLTSIDPAAGTQGEITRIRIHGQHLRPLLRVTIGSQFGNDVLVANPTLAEVVLPEMQPGTYDVVLYDQGQELSRLPRAFTLARPPQSTVPLQVVGTFTALDASAVASLAAGRRFPEDSSEPVAEILTAGPAQPALRRVRVGASVVTTAVPGKLQVSATLRLRCVLVGDECLVGDTLLAPGVPISLPTSAGLVPFWVDDVRADAPATPPAGDPKGRR